MDLHCQGSIAFTSGGGNMEGITTVMEVTSISWVMECLTTLS